MPWFQEARQESLMAKMKEGIQEPPGPEEVKPAQQADASAPTDVPEGDIDGEEGEEEEPDDDEVEDPCPLDSDEMINGPEVD